MPIDGKRRAWLHEGQHDPIHVAPSGGLIILTRAPDEDTRHFLRRLRRLEGASEASRLALQPAPAFFAGLSDDLALPEGSEGYALRFRHTEAEQVKRLAAGDLVAALRP